MCSLLKDFCTKTWMATSYFCHSCLIEMRNGYNMYWVFYCLRFVGIHTELCWGLVKKISLPWAFSYKTWLVTHWLAVYFYMASYTLISRVLRSFQGALALFSVIHCTQAHWCVLADPNLHISTVNYKTKGQALMIWIVSFTVFCFGSVWSLK